MAGVLAAAALTLAMALAASGTGVDPGFSPGLPTATGGTVQMADDNTMGGLAGTWVVTGIAHATLPSRARVTMVFADGRIAGRAACRRYEGDAKTDGDALRLGPLERDDELCDEELMRAETNFMRVLKVSDRFRINTDGTLTLFAQDNEMVSARRADVP